MPLIVPTHIAETLEEKTRIFICLVPGCDKKFPLEQQTQYVRHVRSCSARNEDKIHRVIERNRESYFTKPADEEMYAHFRKGGN